MRFTLTLDTVSEDFWTSVPTPDRIDTLAGFSRLLDNTRYQRWVGIQVIRTEIMGDIRQVFVSFGVVAAE